MYSVYKNIFSLPSYLYEHVLTQSSRGDVIFNNDINDNKRIQFDLNDSLGTEIKTKLQTIITSLGYDGIVNDPVVLKSLPFCKKQRLHCDYDRSLLNNTNEYPYGMLVGIYDNCRLIVSPEFGKKHYVHFNKGDVVIFRGDTIHAGSEYYAENIRLHAYIDTPSYKRDANVTYIEGG